MSDDGSRLREAVNVPDLMERDGFVRKARKYRADAVIQKNTILHWNETHPAEEPIDTAFEDAVIAWCDSILGSR